MSTKQVKVELAVIKCCPSQQRGGADPPAAFLTLGAHEWPGALAAVAAGSNSLRCLHAIASVSAGLLERLFVPCRCGKIKETQGTKHPLASKALKV